MIKNNKHFSFDTSIDIENVNVQNKMYILMISTIMKLRIVKEVITITIKETNVSSNAFISRYTILITHVFHG